MVRQADNAPHTHTIQARYDETTAALTLATELTTTTLSPGMASLTASPDPGAAAPHEADGLPTPRRYWAMLTIWLAIGLSVLDGAIANVALPTIARDLGTDPASSIWIINAYQLAVVVTLLPLASVGDKVGYKRVYMVGIAVFTLGSMACALSHTLAQLTAARVLQGLGAAGVMSINAALVRFTTPHRLLGRAIGTNALVIAVVTAAGPSIAAAILGVASWPWLFAVNVPIGILTIAVAGRALPQTPGSRGRLDFIAATLNVMAFAGVILGVEGLARGGAAAQSAALLLSGLAAGALLVRRELGEPAPMVPIDLLKIPSMRLSVATSVSTWAAQMLAFVALPFYLQDVAGRGVVEIGLLMTPWPLAVGLMAPLSGRLADKHSAGVLCGAGLAVFAVGLGLLAMLPAGASNADIVWRMVVCGAGFGFFQAPNNRALVSAAPRNRSGAAGGVLATCRLLGQTIGAATLAVLFHLGMAHPTVSALGIAAAVAALASGFSLMRLRQRST